MTADGVKWLVAVCMFAYIVGGSVGFGLWFRRLEQLRRTQSHGWPLPLPPRLLFAMQAYSLGAIPLACLGVLSMTPVLQTKAAPAWILRFAMFFVGGAILYATQDVRAMRKSRRAARRQAGAHLDGASPPR